MGGDGDQGGRPAGVERDAVMAWLPGNGVWVWCNPKSGPARNQCCCCPAAGRACSPSVWCQLAWATTLKHVYDVESHAGTRHPLPGCSYPRQCRSPRPPPTTAAGRGAVDRERLIVMELRPAR